MTEAGEVAFGSPPGHAASVARKTSPSTSPVSEMTLGSRLWHEVAGPRREGVVDRVTSVLREHLGVSWLLIRRYDEAPPQSVTPSRATPQLVSPQLVTVISSRAEDAEPWPLRTELAGSTAKEALRWLQGGEFFVRSRAVSPPAWLVPAEIEDGVVAVPLGQGDAPVGLAVLGGSSTIGREPHLSALRAVVAPLRMLLEQEEHVHELARLRETLASDRQELLSKLQGPDLSTVIGETGGLALVMERVEKVAPTEVPVLILGETGSGKEVIARTLHARSRRASGPVVRINCGAIPAELIDSELFGHERGSFTGAVGTRKGWFERADGGTLFLDEIGELPLAAQVRLLRVLQDGTLERVGGHKTIVVDVRIVAATHRNLEAMVAEGAFREDLWYRLSVFPLRLPALRERMEDLPAFATHFARLAGQRLGNPSLAPTVRDLEKLSRYAWPGNVRELAAVLERAAILGNGRYLELDASLGAASHDPSSVEDPREATLAGGATAAATNQVVPTEGRTIAPLDEAIAAHIRRALAACHGRIEGPFGAAEALGINPHTLRARMRKLGIAWAGFRKAHRPPLTPRGR